MSRRLKKEGTFEHGWHSLERNRENNLDFSAAPAVSAIFFRTGLASQPHPDGVGKLKKIIQLIQVFINVVPVEPKVLVDQSVSKARDGSEPLREIRREHTEFAHNENRFMITGGLPRFLEGNDPVADVDAALGRNLEVAFYDIAQIGISIKIGPRFVPEGFQSRQALVEFVQALCDTAGLE